MFETALREELFLKTMTRMDMVASSLGSTQIGVSKTPTQDLMFFLKCMFLSKQSENNINIFFTLSPLFKPTSDEL